MAITSTDLKLRASERMADDTSTTLGVGGGGRLGTTIISGSAENDMFPDVMPADRISGKTILRKAWVAAMSNENDPLSNAGLAITARPSDANCRVALFKADGNDLQYQALTRLRTTAHATVALADWAYNYTSSTQFLLGVTPAVLPVVGKIIEVSQTLGASTTVFSYQVITAVSGLNVTISPGGLQSGRATSFRDYVRNTAAGAPDFCALALSTASAASGTSFVPVDRLEERFDQTGSTYGKAGAQLMFFPGDEVLVQHGTTDTTREFRVVDYVDYVNNRVYFTATLTNTYPSGSKVTRVLRVGLVQAAVTLSPFSQQTWQRVWSDTVTTPATAGYSGPVTLVNSGAANDRWAIVFSSSTAFDLISERYGQLVSGTTTADFSPINPATSTPYFTLLASGWGSGWLPGNCVRFNTRAAAGAVWASRCVLPSAAGGTVNATLTMTGDVNA